MPTSIAPTFAPTVHAPVAWPAIRRRQIVDVTRIAWIVGVLALGTLGIVATFAPASPTDPTDALGIVVGP